MMVGGEWLLPTVFSRPGPGKINERKDFQKGLGEELRGIEVWSTNNHPGMGADAGAPDMYVLTQLSVLEHGPFPMLIPVELKIGWMKNEELQVSPIRPDQIGWHASYRKSGGTSAFVVGIPKVRKGQTEWAMAILPQDQVLGGQDRFLLADCDVVPAIEDFCSMITFRIFQERGYNAQY